MNQIAMNFYLRELTVVEYEYKWTADSMWNDHSYNKLYKIPGAAEFKKFTVYKSGCLRLGSK